MKYIAISTLTQIKAVILHSFMINNILVMVFVEINSEQKYWFSTGGNIVELNVFQDPPHRDWYNSWHSLLMHGRLLVSWNTKKYISNI